MNKPIEYRASGETGVVYAKRDGTDIRDFAPDEGVGRTGWKQTGPNMRRKVKRVRIGTVCEWREIDNDPPADHREYPLF